MWGYGFRRFAVAVTGLAGLALLAPSAASAQTPPMGVTDLQAPTIQWVVSSLSTARPSISMSWHAADDLSGVLGTDVRWRARNADGTWSSWHRPAAWQGLPATAQVSKRITAGKAYRFQVRAHDVAGNVSSWEALSGVQPGSRR